MTTILIITFICLFLTAFTSIAAAAYLYGVTQTQSKMTLALARDKKRLHRSLELWQNAFVKATGKGSLIPSPPKKEGDGEKKTTNRVVSPTDAVERQAQKDRRNPQVETSLLPQKTAFLDDVAPAFNK